MRAQAWLVGAALVVAMALAVAGGWLLHRTIRRRRLRAQVYRAQTDERRAVRLLESHGFRVYGQQVQQQYAVAVDGEPQTATVRADLLVARGRRRYVVEVKTGKVAKPTLATTRRQLLEYLLAFRVDGVLLADMNASRLHRVDFGLGRASRGSWRLIGALVAGLIAGAVITAIVS